MICQKDDKNSSTCWIALVQRYNFPCQVMKYRGKPVENISDAVTNPHFDQSLEVNTNDEGYDQLVTVGISDDSKDVTPIDFSTIEHVQCCGHQV